MLYTFVDKLLVLAALFSVSKLGHIVECSKHPKKSGHAPTHASRLVVMLSPNFDFLLGQVRSEVSLAVTSHAHARVKI